MLAEERGLHMVLGDWEIHTSVADVQIGFLHKKLVEEMLLRMGSEG